MLLKGAIVVLKTTELMSALEFGILSVAHVTFSEALTTPKHSLGKISRRRTKSLPLGNVIEVGVVVRKDVYSQIRFSCLPELQIARLSECNVDFLSTLLINPQDLSFSLRTQNS